MKSQTIGLISAAAVGVVLVILGVLAFGRSASPTTASAVPTLASYASAFSKPQTERSMVPQQAASTGCPAGMFCSNWYMLNLNRDCSTYNGDMFFYDLTKNGGSYGNTTVTADRVQVVKMVCGSLTAFFFCKSTLSTDDATQLCENIVKAAEDKQNPINRITNGLTWTTQPDIYNDDGTSNNGIYALYTLILVPIFCVAGFMIWYRMKQSQADTQYLQDTAAFSNIAARAPAQPYDPTPAPAPVTVLQPPVMQAAPQYAYTVPVAPAVQPTPSYYPPQYTTPYVAPAAQPVVYGGGYYPAQ